MALFKSFRVQSPWVLNNLYLNKICLELNIPVHLSISKPLERKRQTNVHNKLQCHRLTGCLTFVPCDTL